MRGDRKAGGGGGGEERGTEEGRVRLRERER